MKIVKMSLVSIFLVLSASTSSYAWGDREQGALIGAGAAILLGGIINNAVQQPRYVESRPVYVESRPVYYETRPTVVYREPYVSERVIIIEDNPPRPPHRYHDEYYRPYYR
ncbi:MAG: hypothetical protein LRY52_12210 [Sulfurospirillum cavolei]|nr:hypothetical protein [Sulfurospirillum cavolei]